MSSTNKSIVALNSEPQTNQQNINEIENSNQAIIPYIPSLSGRNHLNQPLVLSKDDHINNTFESKEFLAEFFKKLVMHGDFESLF